MCGVNEMIDFLKGGVLSPGPRFILELRPFLHELFGEDIAHCQLCKDPAIQVYTAITHTHTHTSHSTRFQYVH